MEIGVNCSGEKASTVKNLGYDFIEENFTALSELTSEQADELAKLYDKIGIHAYSTCCFFPGSMRLYEDDSLEKIRKYATRGFENARKLGVKICVLGSGGVRNIPDGVSREETERKFCEILNLLGTLAEKYSISIAVEPLGKTETNFIHTVKEAVDVVKKCGKKNVGALVDFYHFFRNGDTYDEILNAGDALIHAHIARPNPDRRPPQPEDMPIVTEWAEVLKKAGFKGKLTLECAFGSDFDKAITDVYPLLECFRKI